MPSKPPHQPSQLFTIRLWAEALGDEKQEIRGKVQHVVSGEARHFRDWITLETFLMAWLKTQEQQASYTNQSEEVDRGIVTGNDDQER